MQGYQRNTGKSSFNISPIALCREQQNGGHSVLNTESVKVDNSFLLLKSGTGIWLVRLKGERDINLGRQGKEMETEKRKKDGAAED